MSADLPDWTPQGAESWKATLPIGRAAAARVADGLPELDALDPPPVYVASEVDAADAESWRLDVYFEREPGEDELIPLRELGAGNEPAIERVEDADWTTISQAWLEPIRAGRFYVHTAAHADGVPAGALPFRIEASRAFGTGHHETTSGCLELLSMLADEGRTFARVADVGTGTGLLAFAAHRLWPDAEIVATDIDPVALPVIRENIAANAIAPDSIALAVADGVDHPLFARASGLLIANILAGPLIALAADFARVTTPGATAILAGLLRTQADDVLAAYRSAGFREARRLERGDWSILAVERGE